MKTKSILLAVMMVCMLGLVARAEMAVSTATGNGADTFVGNDSNRSPNNNYGSNGSLDVRNYPGVRSHIGIFRLDIEALGGVDTTGALLQLFRNSGGQTRDFSIYGVTDEAYDNWGEMSLTYNNCPWLLPTDPQANGNYVIDETKAKFLGTYHLNEPEVGFVVAREVVYTDAENPENSTNDALGLFLKEDTNNLVTLMIIGSSDGRQFYFDAKENSAYNPDYAITDTDPNNHCPPAIVLPVEPNPYWASGPVPTHKKTVSLNLSQLSWTNPEPNDVSGTITCDVYFGTTEPNTAESDYGLAYTLATGTPDTSVSLPISLAPYSKYYWVVDVHDSSQSGVTHRGRLWSMNTFNQAPSVSAGNDQFLWLGHLGDPVSATAVINATVTDDGLPDPLTYLWEQISGPTVAISPNNTEDITQVFTEAGTYVLQLTASDGAESSSDQVQIFVGADACEASQARPGYAGNAMDFNDDCFVDISDFADFAAEWLDCRSLDCP